MALALEAKAQADDILIGDTPKAVKRRRRIKGVQSAGRLWKHSTLRDIVGLVEPDDIARARVFTMVRNPFDRVVSYYSWLEQQEFDHPAVSFAKQLNFGDFLNQDMVKASFRAAPYASYVSTAKDSERCDLFLRLEHLEEDMPRLEALIETKLGPIPHENTSEHHGVHTPATRAIVEDVCAEDIARFGYRFECP